MNGDTGNYQKRRPKGGSLAVINHPLSSHHSLTTETPGLNPIAYPIALHLFHLENPAKHIENHLAVTMGVRDSQEEATGALDPVEKGFATLNTIR